MSFAARFELPSINDGDIDLSKCDTCPHRHEACWNAGRCLMEDDLV